MRGALFFFAHRAARALARRLGSNNITCRRGAKPWWRWPEQRRGVKTAKIRTAGSRQHRECLSTCRWRRWYKHSSARDAPSLAADAGMRMWRRHPLHARRRVYGRHSISYRAAALRRERLLRAKSYLCAAKPVSDASRHFGAHVSSTREPW